MKRFKMLSAILACMLPALFFLRGLSWMSWLIGLPFALVYANIFEFWFHRWYHEPKSPLFKNHRDHHIHASDPEHVDLFGGSFRGIAGLIAANIAPFVWLKSWPVILIGFGSYLVLTEEIHRRAHLGGWIPESFRRYHLAHHEVPVNKFNIWLPLGDWLFGGRL